MLICRQEEEKEGTETTKQTGTASTKKSYFATLLFSAHHVRGSR